MTNLDHFFYLLAKEKHDPKAAVRNRGDVVFPAGSKNVKDDKDHFPINSESQARNALSRSGQYSSAPPWYSGSLDSLKSAVRNAVKRKYPDIKVTEPKKSDAYSDEAYLMVVKADDMGGDVDDDEEVENTYNGPQKRGGGQPPAKKKKKKK